MPQLTPDQIAKLKSLGIEVNDQPIVNSPTSSSDNLSSSQPIFVPLQTEITLSDLPDLSIKNQPNLTHLTTSPTIDDSLQTPNLTQASPFFKGRCPEAPGGQRGLKHNNVFPLLSISGLTILSLSGLILFKNKDQANTAQINNSNTTLPETNISPTQVPKSIQHYLLTSQQFFTQASQNQSVEALNQSIVAATDAIKEFPNDYRGYYQRGRIYQSVLTSQPQLISQVLSDLSQAQKLDPTNAEITRSLASAYAVKGDAPNTISYLSQTIALEPTKAQNFYDLAKIQQQVGLLTQAVETYGKLLTILSDPNQKTQVESEKTSLQQLISQNPQAASQNTASSPIALPSDLPSSLDSPAIQASTGSGLIVAAPEKLDQIEVSNLTGSNSLSGTATLASGQKQITLSNTQVTSVSQVYVSILSGGKNQNLQVFSKSDNSFIIGLDSPISEDIQFKWWIIN